MQQCQFSRAVAHLIFLCILSHFALKLSVNINRILFYLDILSEFYIWLQPYTTNKSMQHVFMADSELISPGFGYGSRQRRVSLGKKNVCVLFFSLIYSSWQLTWLKVLHIANMCFLSHFQIKVHSPPSKTKYSICSWADLEGGGAGPLLKITKI